MNQSTLIIGCGYLGLRVAEHLVARGEAVFGTTRQPIRVDELRSAGITPLLLDVTVQLVDTLPVVDRVLYNIGFDRNAGASMRQVYVQGLAEVLRLLAGRPARFVYASSTSVYGRGNGEWVDESSPTNPHTEAGRICLDAETTLRDQRPEAVVLRLAGLYGPNRIIRRAGIEAGQPFAADPDSFLNLIHIDDAAKAAVAALDSPAPEPLYNVSDGTPVTRRAYAETLARRLAAPPPSFAPHQSPDPANRRINNRRLREGLGCSPDFPDLEIGLRDSLERTPRT